MTVRDREALTFGHEQSTSMETVDPVFVDAYRAVFTASWQTTAPLIYHPHVHWYGLATQRQNSSWEMG